MRCMLHVAFVLTFPYTSEAAFFSYLSVLALSHNGNLQAKIIVTY